MVVTLGGVVRGGGSGGGRRAGGRRHREMGDEGGRPEVVSAGRRTGGVPGVSGGEGRGACAARCSLKCIHSCLTPAVAQVESARSVRRPSISEQSCRAGPTVLWGPQAGSELPAVSKARFVEEQALEGLGERAAWPPWESGREQREIVVEASPFCCDSWPHNGQTPRTSARPGWRRATADFIDVVPCLRAGLSRVGRAAMP